MSDLVFQLISQAHNVQRRSRPHYDGGSQYSIIFHTLHQLRAPAFTVRRQCLQNALPVDLHDCIYKGKERDARCRSQDLPLEVELDVISELLKDHSAVLPGLGISLPDSTPFLRNELVESILDLGLSLLVITREPEFERLS
jgi:hypothetical protein